MSIECVSINSSSRQHTFAEVVEVQPIACEAAGLIVLLLICFSLVPGAPDFLHNIMYANNLLAQADTFGKQNRVTSLSWDRLGWYGACKMLLYSPERSVLECVCCSWRRWVHRYTRSVQRKYLPHCLNGAKGGGARWCTLLLISVPILHGTHLHFAVGKQSKSTRYPLNACMQQHHHTRASMCYSEDSLTMLSYWNRNN